MEISLNQLLDQASARAASMEREMDEWRVAVQAYKDAAKAQQDAARAMKAERDKALEGEKIMTNKTENRLIEERNEALRELNEAFRALDESRAALEAELETALTDLSRVTNDRDKARAECERLRKPHGFPHDSNCPLCNVLVEVGNEVESARAKFPSNDMLFKALVEEVGELGKALMGHEGDVREEAMHVACVAARIMLEGEGKG